MNDSSDDNRKTIRSKMRYDPSERMNCFQATQHWPTRRVCTRHRRASSFASPNVQSDQVEERGESKTRRSGGAMITRSRLHRRRYLLQYIAIFILVFGLSVKGDQSSGGALSSSAGAKRGTMSSSASSLRNVDDSNNDDDDDGDASVKVVSDILQITETEIWDGSKWKSGESRWTTQPNRPLSGDERIGSTIRDGQPCASPDKQEPSEGFKFDGDWKIVTGGSSRDSYGWEYTIAQPFPVRQRVWLRNLVPVEDKKLKKPKKEIFKISRKKDAAADDDRKKMKRRKQRRKLPKVLRAITDDFNFKGFGLSFYKSLVFAQSFGMAFRIPLTYNFGRWETNRGLPSVSSSIGIYYPPMAMVSISTSVRLEFLKWLSGRLVETVCYLLLATFWTFLRGIILALSAVLFPITRKLYQPPVPMKAPWTKPNSPVYSRILEERVGCSISWRISRSRGYHTRVSYWHYYAPTLASTWPAVQAISSLLFKNKDKIAMPDWWARRKAAYGLSTSCPIPDQPHVTSSMLLSLSGYYLKPPQSVRLVTSSTSGASPKVSSSIQKKNDSASKTTTTTKITPPPDASSSSDLELSISSDEEEHESENIKVTIQKVKKA